jgi:hypothetical protein
MMIKEMIVHFGFCMGVSGSEQRIKNYDNVQSSNVLDQRVKNILSRGVAVETCLIVLVP